MVQQIILLEYHNYGKHINQSLLNIILCCLTKPF